MKVLVCGDTHGDRQALAYLARAAASHQVGLLAHTGDFYRDFQWLQAETGIKGYGVPGNCDYGSTEPEEQLFQLAGTDILLVHGHQYRVKRGPNRLLKEARKRGVGVVLFGHSHMPLVRWHRDLLLVNPGSLYWPRGGSKPAFALLELGSGKPPQAEIIAAT